MNKSNCCVCDENFEDNQIKEKITIRSNVRKFANEKFTVWRCPKCLSLHSLESVDLDYYYKFYPLQSQKADFVMKRSFANRLSMIEKSGLKKEALILDYGCGNGLFVQYLLECGYNAFGYDPYVPQYSDSECLNKKYDVVTAYDVIEHAENPQDCLGKLAALIKQGGQLVLGTPNATNMDLTHPENCMLELHQPYHRHIFSQQALINFAKNKGLILERVYDRFYLDTLFPFVNTRFAWTYIKDSGNNLDTVTEGISFSKILKSPKLLFYGYFGYFFPVRSNMTVRFRLVSKKHEVLDYISRQANVANI